MDRLLRSCVAELLASFVFVFLAAGAICADAFMTNQGKPGIGILGICLAGGIAYAVVVTATMHMSGGHANPAITLGLWFAGKLEAGRALYYVMAQMLGAVIAGFFLTVIFGNTYAIDPKVALGTPHAAVLGNLFGREMDVQLRALATLIELLCTFVLVFVFFGTVVYRQYVRVGGFAAGLAVTAAMLVAYQFTGAAMNPARYFGTGLWEAGVSSDYSRLADCYIYVLGPILGAVLAAWIYSSYVAGDVPGEPGASATGVIDTGPKR
jgi:MIP family channel proteins